MPTHGPVALTSPPPLHPPRILHGDRPEFAAAGRFPPKVDTLTGDYLSIVESFACDGATYIVIMTRGHLQDLACVRAAFRKKHRYLGFIGSARKTRLILEQLRLEGLDPAGVEAIFAPIGMDIAAETPEEIAISILAELIAVRRNAPALSSINEARKKRRA